MPSRRSPQWPLLFILAGSLGSVDAPAAPEKDVDLLPGRRDAGTPGVGCGGCGGGRGAR